MFKRLIARKKVGNKIVPVQTQVGLFEDTQGLCKKYNLDSSKYLDDFLIHENDMNSVERKYLMKLQRFQTLYGESMVKYLTTLEDAIIQRFTTLLDVSLTFTSKPLTILNKEHKVSKYGSLLNEFDMILWTISESFFVMKENKINILLQKNADQLENLSSELKPLHGLVKNHKSEIKLLKNQVYHLEKVFEEEFPSSITTAKYLYNEFELSTFDINESKTTRELAPEAIIQLKTEANGFSIFSPVPNESETIWKNVNEIPEIYVEEIVNGMFNELIDRAALGTKEFSISNTSSASQNRIVDGVLEKLFRLANFRGLQIAKCYSTTILFCFYRNTKLLETFVSSLVHTLETLTQVIQRVDYIKLCLDETKKFKPNPINPKYCSSFQVQLYTKWNADTHFFIAKPAFEMESKIVLIEPQEKISTSEKVASKIKNEGSEVHGNAGDTIDTLDFSD